MLVILRTQRLKEGEGEGPDDILSRLPLTKCYFPTVKNASANVLRVLNIFFGRRAVTL